MLHIFYIKLDFNTQTFVLFLLQSLSIVILFVIFVYILKGNELIKQHSWKDDVYYVYESINSSTLRCHSHVCQKYIYHLPDLTLSPLSFRNIFSTFKKKCILRPKVSVDQTVHNRVDHVINHVKPIQNSRHWSERFKYPHPH